MRETHGDAAVVLAQPRKLRLPVAIVAKRPVDEEEQLALTGFDIWHGLPAGQFDERPGSGKYGLIHGWMMTDES
jgi:hypothetical protein